MSASILLLQLLLLATATITSAQQVMVVGGYEFNTNNHAEAIDLSTATTNCNNISDFPGAWYGSVGSYIDGVVMVCGGKNGRDNLANTDYCYEYDHVGDNWERSVHSLMKAKRSAAAVMLPDGRWWVTGGYDGSTLLSDTVVFDVENGGFVPFVELPERRMNHNLVTVDDRRVMLVGGYQYNSDAFMFDLDTNTWSRLPNLPIETGQTQAGLVTRADGSKEVVVVAGYVTSATQIYSVESMTWRLGPDFPSGSLFMGSSMQHKDTFLVLGGAVTINQVDIDQDSVFMYDSEVEEWVEMPQKLAMPSRESAAFSMPNNFVSCM